MTSYLLDTNILLRAADTSSETHSLANEAITHIIETENECIIIPQIVSEFWVVATRPLEVNGLGWTIQQTRNHVDDMLDNFTLLEDNYPIFQLWLELVTDYKIKGKRTHDLKILALMKFYNITHLLTFNPTDFIPIPNITILRPQDIIS